MTTHDSYGRLRCCCVLPPTACLWFVASSIPGGEVAWCRWTMLPCICAAQQVRRCRSPIECVVLQRNRRRDARVVSVSWAVLLGLTRRSSSSSSCCARGVFLRSSCSYRHTVSACISLPCAAFTSSPRCGTDRNRPRGSQIRGQGLVRRCAR